MSPVWAHIGRRVKWPSKHTAGRPSPHHPVTGATETLAGHFPRQKQNFFSLHSKKILKYSSIDRLEFLPKEMLFHTPEAHLCGQMSPEPWREAQAGGSARGGGDPGRGSHPVPSSLTQRVTSKEKGSTVVSFPEVMEEVFGVP